MGSLWQTQFSSGPSVMDFIFCCIPLAIMSRLIQSIHLCFSPLLLLPSCGTISSVCLPMYLGLVSSHVQTTSVYCIVSSLFNLKITCNEDKKPILATFRGLNEAAEKFYCDEEYLTILFTSVMNSSSSSASFPTFNQSINQSILFRHRISHK